MDPQQCQPSGWVPILPIPNHFKLHPCSHIHTTSTPPLTASQRLKILEVVQQQQLFTEKQSFVYAVLLKTLQTDCGRALVREHEYDKDAQQILYELHQHHTDSELSRAEVLTLTTYVANLKLIDNWRGTTHHSIPSPFQGTTQASG